MRTSRFCWKICSGVSDGDLDESKIGDGTFDSDAAGFGATVCV